MRRAALAVAAAAVLAGCGDEDVGQEAVERRAAAERVALVQIVGLQQALRGAQDTYAEGEPEAASTAVLEAYTLHFDHIRGPLRDIDADLASELVDELNSQLPALLASDAPRAEVRRLFEQIQTDLLTAAEAIKA